jgi:hypothetical protein
MAQGYGESEAYRAGLYPTDRGLSFYPPNDEEEENDMAVEDSDAVSGQD